MIDKKVSRNVPLLHQSHLISRRNRRGLTRSVSMYYTWEYRKSELPFVAESCRWSLICTFAAFVSRRKQGKSNGRKFRPPAENSPTRPQIPSSATTAAAAAAAASRAERSRTMLCRAVPCRLERDDNFTAKCTTGPSGTFTPRFESSHSPVRNPPPSSLSLSLSLLLRSLCLPVLPASLLSSSFFLSFFRFFFLDARCIHARVREPSARFTRRHAPKSTAP